VYGQIVLKWRIDKYGRLPPEFFDKLLFLFRLLLDPFVLSGLLSAFLASLFWMRAMTRLDRYFGYRCMEFAVVFLFLLFTFCFVVIFLVFFFTCIFYRYLSIWRAY